MSNSDSNFTSATSSNLSWAEVLEQNPDPNVVTDADFLKHITETKLPWRVKHKKTCIEMLLVPPGKFMMGASPGDTQAEDSEKPAHEVTLTKAFYLGRTEVTQEQWMCVMDTNPSKFVGKTLPVDSVSFEDVSVFLKKAGDGLQLPTEAQWEYAYRAGTTTPFHSYPGQPTGFNDGSLLGNIAWYLANAESQTHAVGGKFANALGLHDMSGNVFEWCQDWYGAYSSAAQTDPTGPATGTSRLLRGGYWRSDPNYCRASRRGSYEPAYVIFNFSLRVARTP
ncbi:MAG: formylglycine-generating enzyme family protein [Planctomycetota bacterium]|nr:formylglycine-generating enzyme family protein [Planctomycetota bacterium]